MGFLSMQTKVTYEVPTASFLPTFAVVSNFSYYQPAMNEEYWNFNDESSYGFEFY